MALACQKTVYGDYQRGTIADSSKDPGVDNAAPSPRPPFMTDGRMASQARILTSFLLLWLAGIGLRLTILAVPPVIPLIHDELNLSATQIGILTGLPSMLFAIAAVPGSLLIARLGVNTALVVGLAITAIGGALRGLWPDVGWLYAMTVAMSAGVAIM
jgi:MFS transporter, CP family, cyanate transporter